MNGCPLVSIVIVSWNSALYLASCLQSVMSQNWPATELLVIDNASSDGSQAILREQFQIVRQMHNEQNLGYAAAMNQALSLTRGTYLLTLNPDVTLAPDFMTGMVAAAEADPRIGSVAARLISPQTIHNPQLTLSDPKIKNSEPLLDSTGLFIDRARRTRDRGQGQVDQGQYDDQTEVFSACGAAALYRRDMLADVATEGEVFDEDFFAYYEDADLGWRARLRGWRCVYAPQAIAFHARGAADTLQKVSNAPKRLWIQAHALKNRYLMLIKNDLWADVLNDLPWIVSHDLPRLAYAALRAPGALAGLRAAWGLRKRALHKREIIQRRRQVPPDEIRPWFLQRV